MALFTDLRAATNAVAQAERAFACTRCNGQGRINAFRSIDNGRCFGCGGTGKWQRKAA